MAGIGFILDGLEEIAKRVSKKFRGKNAGDLATAAADAIFNQDYKRKSIRSQASRAVAYFPVVASQNISFDTTVVLTKYIERSIADMIKIIIGNQDVINLDRNASKETILAAFQGATIGVENDGDNNNIIDATFKRYTDREMRRVGGRGMSEGSTKIVSRIKDDWGQIISEASVQFDSGLNLVSLQEMSSELVTRMNGNLSEAKGSPTNKPKGPKDLGGGRVAMRNDKANDLSPTILDIEVIYMAGGVMSKTNLVMAIKCTSHIVQTDVMINEIGLAVQQKRFGFPLIQWATGEISLVKDLILNINDTKRRVISGHHDKGIRYLNRLRLMSSKNRLNAATDGRTLLPTTTIVLTSDEVAQIRDEYAVDLKSTKEAEKFFQLYGLMNFIIVDESTGAMYIFDEVRGQFDVTSVPKEATENKQQGDVIKALVASMGAK